MAIKYNLFNILNLVDSLILIITFIFGIIKLNNSINQEKLRLFHEMATHGRELEIKLFEITERIKSSKDKQDLELKRDIIVNQYLNFLEQLCLFINEKKINERFAKKYYNTILNQANENYKDLIYPTYTQIIITSIKWGVVKKKS